MKRLLLTVCAALTAVLFAAGSALAEPTQSGALSAQAKFPVTFTANTTFQDPPAPDEFTGTITGCTSGTVEDTAGGAVFTPWGGVFVGVKSFTCAGSEGGFDVRLNARFGDPGSVGTWNIVDAWGTLEGLKGSGSLVGIPTEDGIDDIYTGTLH
jgi:hypothetical protein